MNVPAGYRLTGYGEMMAPNARMEGYVRALQNAVHPGCIVLDVGAGTGIFSLLACKFGAGHVHAVEPDDAVLLGEMLARANGFAGRITFHQKLSTQVSLPKRADVIVSDLRGIIPLFQQHIPAIIDARQRHLAPGGALIASRDTIYAALIESPDLYERYRHPWLQNDYGLDLSAGHSLVVNGWRKARIEPAQLLTSAQVWAVLDYRTIKEPDVTGELEWTAERAGVAHGLGLWFDAELGYGVGFSNAPGEPELIYGHAFFPLEKEVKVDAGDRITIRLAANLVGANYIFRWDTCIEAADQRIRARFKQSTFLGDIISLAKLKKADSCFVPAATQEKEIDARCLALANGTRNLGEIAEALRQSFPDRFAQLHDALAHVANFFAEYPEADGAELL